MIHNLIRRISSSFFPRNDRPWDEDATSNAPQIGRKRRFSSIEPDDDSAMSTPKKSRMESVEAEEEQATATPEIANEVEDVKEVIKGVEEVDIVDAKDKPSSATAVPLPNSPELVAEEEGEDVEDVPEISPSQETEIVEGEQSEQEVDGLKEDIADGAVVVDGVHEGDEKAKNSQDDSVSTTVAEEDSTNPIIADEAIADEPSNLENKIDEDIPHDS